MRRALLILAALAAPSGLVAQENASPPTSAATPTPRPSVFAPAPAEGGAIETSPLAPANVERLTPNEDSSGADAAAEARTAGNVYETFRQPGYTIEGARVGVTPLPQAIPDAADGYASRNGRWGFPEDTRGGEIVEVERPAWRSEARAVAVLRGLDKISGRVSDIRAPVNETVTYERLTITVEECRAPPAEEADDAFVFLKIDDPKAGGAAVFSGWMFASSPALSAMDHQRYDVWVLSCATS